MGKLPQASAFLLVLLFFPLEHPAHHEYAVQHGQAPGKGVGKADANIAQACFHGQQAAQTAADELAHAGNDGLHAVAQALQRVAEDHQQAMEAEQHTHNGLHRPAPAPRRKA